MLCAQTRITFMPAATPWFITFTRCSCPSLGVLRNGGDGALEPSSTTSHLCVACQSRGNESGRMQHQAHMFQPAK